MEACLSIYFEKTCLSVPPGSYPKCLANFIICIVSVISIYIFDTIQLALPHLPVLNWRRGFSELSSATDALAWPLSCTNLIGLVEVKLKSTWPLDGDQVPNLTLYHHQSATWTSQEQRSSTVNAFKRELPESMAASAIGAQPLQHRKRHPREFVFSRTSSPTNSV